MECHQVRILVFSDSVMRDRTIKYIKVLWTNQVSNRLFICGSFSQPCVSDAEFGDEFL